MGFFLLSLCPLSLLSLYLCVVQVDLITTKERYRGWADKVAGWAALLVNGFDKQRVQVVPHALDDGLEVQVGDYMAVFQRMVDFCIWATSQIELEVAAAKANMATGNGTGLGRGGGWCNSAFSGLPIRTLEALHWSRAVLGLSSSLLLSMAMYFKQQALSCNVRKRKALTRTQEKDVVGYFFHWLIP